jgi:hypothetical protein
MTQWLIRHPLSCIFVSLSVHRFAQLTGDAKTLSATDVQIIALTYQLEKQYNGMHFLKTEPVRTARGTEQREDASGGQGHPTD